MTDAHDEAVRHALLLQLHADLQAGGLRSETEYEARFPGRAEWIAAELAALRAASDAPVAAAGAAGFTIGPYAIRRELGRGGQAIVYLAHDDRLQRDVALKVLPRAGAGPAQELRLRREATAAARLDDSGICPVYEIGEDGAHLWLSMKYLDGRTLSGLLAEAHARVREGAGLDDVMPPAERTLLWFERLLASLGRAHGAGVLHRDLKPGNIMIGNDGQPVLLDFGLAITTDEAAPVTRSGDLLGTPAYLSPERLRCPSQRGDIRDDLWALAVGLYEALVLQRPFQAPTIEQVYRAILDRDPVPPRRLRPSLPRDLDAVLGTALAKDPRRRYASAADFAAELRAVRLGEPVRARPPGPLRRLLGWHRRHRALATFAWTLAVALVVFLIVQQGNLRELRAARAETDDLNTFLIDKLLLASTPDEARGRTPTATEVFDAAMQNIADSFPRPTRSAGTLHHVLGLANARLGRPQVALAGIEQAVAIRTMLLGPVHPDTLASRRERVNLLRQTDQLDRASEEIEALLAALATAGGDHRHDRLGLELDRVRILLARRRAADAEQLAAAAHQELVAAFGEDDRLTIQALQLVARSLQLQGRFTEAEPRMREVIERRGRGLGTDSLPYVAALSDHAQVLQDLVLADGRRDLLPAAQTAYELALATSERLYGRDSSFYATVANSYASLLQFLAGQQRDAALGQRAIDLYRASLAVRERLDGPESARVATTLGNLGGALIEQGQQDEAIPLLQRGLQLRAQLFGPRHGDTVRALFNLMMALAQCRRLDEAVAVRDDLRERLAGNDGVDEKLRLSFRVGMVSVSMHRGEWEAAVRDGEPIHADCSRVWPPDGGPTGRRVADFVRAALERLGRSEDAEIWRQRSGFGKR